MLSFHHPHNLVVTDALHHCSVESGSYRQPHRRQKWQPAPSPHKTVPHRQPSSFQTWQKRELPPRVGSTPGAYRAPQLYKNWLVRLPLLLSFLTTDSKLFPKMKLQFPLLVISLSLLSSHVSALWSITYDDTAYANAILGPDSSKSHVTFETNTDIEQWLSKDSTFTAIGKTDRKSKSNYWLWGKDFGS